MQQDQSQTETATVVLVPVNNLANAVQNNQQQFSTQLQQMQTMMQAMHIQYVAAPHGTRQDYGGRQDYGEGG